MNLVLLLPSGECGGVGRRSTCAYVLAGAGGDIHAPDWGLPVAAAIGHAFPGCGVVEIAVIRLDPDPTANPVTMNRFLVTVTVSWQTRQTDVSTARTKTAIFTTVVAPE